MKIKVILFKKRKKLFFNIFALTDCYISNIVIFHKFQCYIFLGREGDVTESH